MNPMQEALDHLNKVRPSGIHVERAAGVLEAALAASQPPSGDPCPDCGHEWEAHIGGSCRYAYNGDFRERCDCASQPPSGEPCRGDASVRHLTSTDQLACRYCSEPPSGDAPIALSFKASCGCFEQRDTGAYGLCGWHRQKTSQPPSGDACCVECGGEWPCTISTEVGSHRPSGDDLREAAQQILDAWDFGRAPNFDRLRAALAASAPSSPKETPGRTGMKFTGWDGSDDD